nr:unnamed protein product [Callosobruchus analis]
MFKTFCRRIFGQKLILCGSLERLCNSNTTYTTGK